MVGYQPTLGRDHLFLDSSGILAKEPLEGKGALSQIALTGYPPARSEKAGLKKRPSYRRHERRSGLE